MKDRLIRSKIRAVFTRTTTGSVILRLRGQQQAFATPEELMEEWTRAPRPGKVEHAIDMYLYHCHVGHAPVDVDGPRAWVFPI